MSDVPTTRQEALARALEYNAGSPLKGTPNKIIEVAGTFETYLKGALDEETQQGGLTTDERLRNLKKMARALAGIAATLGEPVDWRERTKLLGAIAQLVENGGLVHPGYSSGPDYIQELKRNYETLTGERL